MHAVPFAMGGDFDGDGWVRGTVTLGRGSLALEFHTSPRGEALAVPRKVVIGLDEFASCRFRRGLMHDRLLLRAAVPGALGGIAGSSGEFVAMRFPKSARAEAEALAEELAAVLEERPASARLGPFRAVSSL